MARVTLQTIADRVGVSRMTVSNAYSRPDQLSPTLRERILAAAAELGYVGPDPAARALARGAAGTVGVLLTDSLRLAFTDEVATGFLAAVAEELAPTGLALTLLTGSPGGSGVVPARDTAMDGALVYSCDPRSSGTAWLVRRRLPLVFVDQIPAEGIPSVNIDDRGGARAAAGHLVSLGHRRVGILSSSVPGPHGVVDPPAGTSGAQVSSERMRGWLEGLGRAGIRPIVVQEPPYLAEAESVAAGLLLDAPVRPTAVLCFSDAVALRVVRAAQDRGLRVPEDVSVVGFDDSPLAMRVRPALTTVRQDVEAKGRAAAAALVAEIDRVRHDEGGPPARIVLPTELVVRDSSAPPAPG